MQPTEHETTVAMTAAAKHVYDLERGQIQARTGAPIETWEEADQQVRNRYLDSVTHVVWAALVALPDRLHPWRQLIDETDTNDIPQLQHFHRLIKETLNGR